MPITLTADTVAELRAQAADLFPALAATVPVTQAPGPEAKEAITLREQLEAAQADARAAQADMREAREHLGKLEAAYSTQADLLREAQEAARSGAGPDVTATMEAIAAVCTTLGSACDVAALPALVAEVKQERDQAQTALKEAQEALEGAQLEIKRLRDLGVGTPADPEKKTSRKKAPAKSEAEATPPASDDAMPPAFPANFTSLPALPEGEVPVGTGVIICIESSSAPGGWLTPGGIVERRFEGTNRYEVKLVHGGYHPVHRDAMRAVPEAVRTTNPDLEVKLDRAPVTPLVAVPPSDTTADRLVTDDERKDLKALAERLKLKPEQVVGLIQQHFAPKTSSAELTVTELAQLREHMDREASIPF